MKKLLVISFLLLTSCGGNIDFSLKDFALDLIDNPSKIKDLKANYPQLYNDSVLFFKMKDTSYMEKMMQYMKVDFGKIEANNDIFRVGTHKGYLGIFESQGKKYGYDYNFNPDSVYCFFICKKNQCIDFMFYTKDSKKYIFYIGTNVKNVSM